MPLPLTRLSISYYCSSIWSLAEIVFGFDPAIYVYEEDVGTGSLSVSLMEGNLGEFTLILIAATDDTSTAATSLGMPGRRDLYCLHYSS